MPPTSLLPQPKSPSVFAAESTAAKKAPNKSQSQGSGRQSRDLRKIASSMFQRRLALPFLFVPLFISLIIPLTSHTFYIFLYRISGGQFTTIPVPTYLWVGMILAFSSGSWKVLRNLIETYAPNEAKCQAALNDSCFSVVFCIKHLFMGSVAFVRFCVAKLLLSNDNKSVETAFLWASMRQVTIPLSLHMCTALMSLSLAGYSRYYGPLAVVSISTRPLVDNPYIRQTTKILLNFTHQNFSNFLQLLGQRIQRVEKRQSTNKSPRDGTKRKTEDHESKPTTSLAKVVQLSIDGSVIPQPLPASRQDLLTLSLPKSADEQRDDVRFGPVNKRIRTTSEIRESPSFEDLAQENNMKVEYKWPTLSVTFLQLILHIGCGAVFGLSSMRVLSIILISFFPVMDAQEDESWVKLTFAFCGVFVFLFMTQAVLCLAFDENECMQPYGMPQGTGGTKSCQIDLNHYPKYQYLKGEDIDAVTTLRDVLSLVESDIKVCVTKTPLWLLRTSIFLVVCSPLLGAWLSLIRSFAHSSSTWHNETWPYRLIMQQWNIIHHALTSILFASNESSLQTLAVLVSCMIVFLFGLMYSIVVDVLARLSISQPINLKVIADRHGKSSDNLRSGVATKQQCLNRTFIRYLLCIDDDVSMDTKLEGSEVLKNLLGMNLNLSASFLDIISLHEDSLELKIMEELDTAIAKLASRQEFDTSGYLIRLLMLESVGGIAELFQQGQDLPGSSSRHMRNVAQIAIDQDSAVDIIRCLIALANHSRSLIERHGKSLRRSEELGLALSPSSAYQAELCLRGATRIILTVLQTPSGRHSTISRSILPLVKSAFDLHKSVLNFSDKYYQRLEQVSQGSSFRNRTISNVSGSFPSAYWQQLTAAKAAQINRGISFKEKTGYYGVLCALELDRLHDPRVILSCPLDMYRLLVVADETAHMIFSCLRSLDYSGANRVWMHLGQENQIWLQGLLDAF